MFHHPAWAVGSYSSGPPARGTPQTLIFKTWRMTGHSVDDLPTVIPRVMKFDHVLGITLKLEMYMMQSGPKVSMDMVFQPFSTIAWAYIAAFVALVSMINKVLNQSKSVVGEPGMNCMKIGLPEVIPLVRCGAFLLRFAL